MSTKIYNGIRFETTDIFVLHRHLMEWRQRIEKLTEQARATYLAEECATAIDRAFVGSEVLPPNPLGDAYDDMRNKQKEIKKTGYRYPQVDFEFTIPVLPYRGELYGIVYCEQSDWTKEFVRKDFVTKFPYWDNTDRPTGVSAKVWEERRQIWHAIFDQNPLALGASGFGFTADCTAPDWLFPDIRLVHRKLPSLERRSRMIARDVLILRRAEELGLRSDVSDKFQNVIEASMWLPTDDAKPIYDAEAARIAEALPDITIDMLTPNWKRLVEDSKRRK